MSRIGLVVPPFTGHVNPMLVLARALQKRGHDVFFLSALDAEQKIRAGGFGFIPIAIEEFPVGAWDKMSAENAVLTGFRSSRYLCHGIGRFARGILRDLPEIAARQHFDGVIMDQIAIGTESVCLAINLPLAMACCALTFHAESSVPPIMFSWPCGTSFAGRFRNFFAQLLVYSTGIPVLREIMPFRHKLGLPRMNFDHGNEVPPSLVQVSQQPPFFDFPRARLPDHFHYTGPWVEDDAPRQEPDFPWEKLDGRPMIYASMGTLQNRLERVFHVIAEACANIEAQLVIALGSKTAEVPQGLAGSPIVVHYAPQLALLKRASLVITHAGLNTTLEALREGLPMVALPVANDQPGVASRLKYLGCGEFIPATDLTTQRLRDVLLRVHSSHSYRERALDYSREIRKINGAAKAAELIETAFSFRQRVRRN